MDEILLGGTLTRYRYLCQHVMSSTMTDDHSEVSGVTAREMQQMSDNKRSDMTRLKFDRSRV